MNRRSFEKHCTAIHNMGLSDLKLSCDMCKETFSNTRGLDNHKISAHPRVCSVCFKSFDSRNDYLYTLYLTIFLAMSLEIRPLAALYAPPYFFSDTIERGANAVGMSIPPPATTESGDRDCSPIKHFFCMGGRRGYNAASGLISREITHFLIDNQKSVKSLFT